MPCGGAQGEVERLPLAARSRGPRASPLTGEEVDGGQLLVGEGPVGLPGSASAAAPRFA